MERYIKDNSSRVTVKAMENLYFLMAITIMDSSKMMRNGVTEFLKRMAKYIKSNMEMTNSSAKLKYESCFYN